jgi:hypothetical protein
MPVQTSKYSVLRRHLLPFYVVQKQIQRPTRVLTTGSIPKLEKLCLQLENKENSQLSNLSSARADREKAVEMKVT